MNKYSKKKFLSFATDKQKRVIYQMLLEIYNLWNDISDRNELIVSLNKCLQYNPKLFNISISDNIDKHKLMDMIMNLEQELDIHLKDCNFLADNNHDYNYHIKKEDGNQPLKKLLPVVVILDNLRSSFNVGSIFRTSECLRIERVILCGLTPKPTNKKVCETSMGTTDIVAWDYYEDTAVAIKEYAEKGFCICALETCNNAEQLFDVEFDFPLVIVLGNEALGLGPEIISLCHRVIEIPVRGWKNSLNVANAFAITGYEMFRQYQKALKNKD